MSGPGAPFPVEAMGDPAPARSLDDIDLSALRVSAPPPAPSLSWFPSPPLESGWPHASRASRVSDYFETPWTAACQATLSTRFPRQC